jgi:hypothetical protein
MTEEVLEKKTSIKSVLLGAWNRSRNGRREEQPSQPLIWLKRRAYLVAHPDSGGSVLDGLVQSESSEKNPTNGFIDENKKDVVLERLTRIIENQKKVDRDIRHTLLAALELKDSGDEIADQVMILIAELAAIRGPKLASTDRK